MDQSAFICHSEKDSVIAHKIVAALEQSGIPCWIAPRNISSGATYAASIVQGIKNATIFIVVFTKSSNNSRPVINEIEKANSLDIQIIPFKIHDEEYSDSLEYYLRSRQSVAAYSRPIDEAINELIKSIGLIPPPLPPGDKKKWRLPIVIFLGLILIGSIYILVNRSGTHLNDPSIQNKNDSAVTKDSVAASTQNPNNIGSVQNTEETNSNEPDDLPSIAGVGQNNFFFVRKTGVGNIEYSSGQLGGGGSPWKMINDKTVSGSAPSAAAIGNSIYLVLKDMNNSLLLCQGSFNSTFGDWIPMNFNTTAKPSIAAVGSVFYYFAKNNAGQIYYNYAALSAGGKGWKPVDGNIVAGSAPTAGAVGNHVFVAVRGQDGRIYYNQADLGGSFNQRWDVMDFQTKVAPTIVGAGNYIYIFSVKPSGEVWFTRAQLGQSFEDWKVVDGNRNTNFAVTAGTAGSSNYIFLEMKGEDGKIYLNQGFDRFQNSWAEAK